MVTRQWSKVPRAHGSAHELAPAADVAERRGFRRWICSGEEEPAGEGSAGDGDGVATREEHTDPRMRMASAADLAERSGFGSIRLGEEEPAVDLPGERAQMLAG